MIFTATSLLFRQRILREGRIETTAYATDNDVEAHVVQVHDSVRTPAAPERLSDEKVHHLVFSWSET